MKFLIVIIVLGVISALDARIDFEPILKECAQKHNVKAEDVTKLFNGDIKPADASQIIKCFSMCVTDKGELTKDGKLNIPGTTDSISPYADKKQVDQVISACKDTKGADNCDTSFLILNCITENMSKKKM